MFFKEYLGLTLVYLVGMLLTYVPTNLVEVQALFPLVGIWYLYLCGIMFADCMLYCWETRKSC